MTVEHEKNMISWSKAVSVARGGCTGGHIFLHRHLELKKNEPWVKYVAALDESRCWIGTIIIWTYYIKFENKDESLNPKTDYKRAQWTKYFTSIKISQYYTFTVKKE